MVGLRPDSGMVGPSGVQIADPLVAAFMFTVAMADGSLSRIAATVLLIVLAGCADGTSPHENAGRSSPPCSDGEVHDVGVPGPFDRFASSRS